MEKIILLIVAMFSIFAFLQIEKKTSNQTKLEVNYYNLIKKLFFLIFTSLSTLLGFAQTYGSFPYGETFTSGTQPSEITIPSNSKTISFTTNGMILTPAQLNYFGAAYFNNVKFASSQGIKIEFEYGMYGGTGADGISVFLFDAAETNPTIGADGESLAYMYNRANTLYPTNRQKGLSGAYLGIGLDAWGLFHEATFLADRRKSGISSSVFTNNKSHVTLRGAAGKTNLDDQGRQIGYNGYPLLITKSTLSGSNSGATLKSDGTFQMTTGTADNFLLNTTAFGNTSADANYRKAFIDLIPNPLGGYNVTVKIQHGSYITTVIDNYYYKTSVTYVENANGYLYEMDQITDYTNRNDPGPNTTHTLNTSVPAFFRIGFGASTGASSNIHLIRNLKVTIPYSAISADDSFSLCQNSSGTINPLTNDVAYIGPTTGAPTSSSANIDPASFQFIDANGTTQGVSYTQTGVGTWTYSSTTQLVTFTPVAGYSGTATIKYNIKGNTVPYNDDGYRSLPATISANVNPSPATPILSSVTQPSCALPTGSFTITNYNAAYTYTVTPSTGVTISGNTITAPAGTYTVTATSGTCTSAASANVNIDAQATTPATPVVSVTQPTCIAAGTATISNYNSAYTYTFSPAGPIAGAGGVITGMIAGTSYTITATSGTCTSVASAPATITAVSSTDSDGDGVSDACDLDDDNDGILDVAECPSVSFLPVYHLFDNDTATTTNFLDIYKQANGINSIFVCPTNDCSTNALGALYKRTNITGSVTNLAYDDGKYYSIDNSGNLLFTDDILTGNFTNLGNAQVGSGFKNLGYDNGIFYHWWSDTSTSPITLKLYKSTNPVTSGWTLMGTVVNRPISYTSGGYTYDLKDIAVNDNVFYFYYYNSTTVSDTSIRTRIFSSTNPISSSATWADLGTSNFGDNVYNIAFGSEDLLTICDTDGDGIPNHLDLDSDNDGCPDAIEGGASFTTSDLVNSTMSGGNSGATSGTYNQPVTQNLGNTVGNTATTIGVPTIAGTGQTIGDSQNFMVNSCFTPIDCSPKAYIVMQDVASSATGISGLYTLDITTGQTQLVKSPLLSEASNRYINAIGYNATDGFLYGFRVGMKNANQVVKIDANGNYQLLTITGMPNDVLGNPITGYIVGDIKDNNLYLMAPSYKSVVKIDLATLVATTTSLSDPSSLLASVSDFTFGADGNLYSVISSKKLLKIDLTASTVSSVGDITGASAETGSWSTAFTDAAGNLYAGNNASNHIYKFNYLAGIYSLNAELFNTIIPVAGVSIGDGASCKFTLSSACYKPATTTGTALETHHGITALGRAGADNSNWPMVRKGAWTALEAKTKGFVVNRLTDAQIALIPSANLVEGMMVYNITQDCLQINVDGTATGWKCFNTQACPD